MNPLHSDVRHHSWKCVNAVSEHGVCGNEPQIDFRLIFPVSEGSSGQNHLSLRAIDNESSSRCLCGILRLRTQPCRVYGNDFPCTSIYFSPAQTLPNSAPFPTKYSLSPFVPLIIISPFSPSLSPSLSLPDEPQLTDMTFPGGDAGASF